MTLRGALNRIAEWPVRAWARWVAMWSHRESGETLALVRIGVAMALLYSLLSPLAWGIAADLFTHEQYGGVRPIPGGWLMQWLGGATPRNFWLLYGSSLALTLALLAGVGGRVVAFVLLQTYGGIITSNSYATGGYDFLFTNALWLFVFGDTTRTWSLDCWRRTGSWTSSEPISAWPRYLLIFQLVVLYGSTGLRKTSVVWLPNGGYSALYYALMDPAWTRFDLPEVAYVYPLTQIASAVTVHWEQSALLLLAVYYFRYTKAKPGRIRRLFNRFDLRKPWALVGVGLHVGIIALLNVGPFSYITLAYYPCLFAPHEVARAVRRASDFIRRLSARVAPARP